MTATDDQAPPLPTDAVLADIEEVAVDLARLAGAEIIGALGREIAVEYKRDGRDGQAPTDPVSDVDHAVEALIRERLAERFPDHGIIGEELEVHPDRSREFVWVVDPVDGTANFVNGFPLFAASIGVLHHGRAVVGAIWTSTSHELRPGVYHARHGGPLRFEQHEVPPGRPSTGVRRRLAAAPAGATGRNQHWDHRNTGSTAIECAFVAAGIFTSAVFWGPSIWDVGAGALLVESAGLELWTRDQQGWQAFARFEAPPTVKEEREPSLRDWRRPLLIGQGDSLALFRASVPAPGRWARLRRRWLKR